MRGNSRHDDNASKHLAGCIGALIILFGLCACGAQPPRYPTLEDLNRESCLQAAKPGDSTEAELVVALRGCKTVTKVDDPLPVPGTQSLAYNWQLADGRAGR